MDRIGWLVLVTVGGTVVYRVAIWAAGVFWGNNGLIESITGLSI